MSELDRLERAIRDLYDVRVTHLRSERLTERFQGKIVWKGVVEVFIVHEHPRAGLAFAWAHKTGGGGKRYVAVLGIPPVLSAADAVRASIAQHRT